MARRELHHTLVEAIDALAPPRGSGLAVTHAALDLPLELVAVERDGRPVLAGSAPHSRWRAGVLPPVHLARLEIAAIGEPAPTTGRRDGG